MPHLALLSLGAVLVVQAIAAFAVLLLGRRETALRRALPSIISLAVGVLLATGVIHLMPEALEQLGNRPGVWLALLLTLLGLFAIERIFQMVSGATVEPLPEAGVPGPACHHHAHAARPATLLLGSFTHSLVDGTSIAAAFSVDPYVGWTTALAVALHEIPHRLGDFALLVHMGLQHTRAAWLAILVGMSSLLGWAIVALVGAYGGHMVAWLLPVSAASFIYLSLVDLLPELQTERRPTAVAWQMLCLLAGVALALGLTHLPDA